ncbi:MAG: putative membrane protein [Paraglaciecola sp.]|jgi:putative membrane protein
MDKASTQTPAPAASAHQWRSLSPIAIIYFASSSIRTIFGNLVYLLPAIYIGYAKFVAHPEIWLPVIAGLLALLLLFAVASFRVYRYRLTATNIEIRSGIFKKMHLNLPFERIQNVKIEQPLYYRLTGFACLQLDTAGSSTQEAKVVALPLNFAEQLKQRILGQALAATQEQGPSEQGIAAPDSPETVLNRRSLTDLIIHGITSNRIWIFLGGLAPFFDNIAEKAEEWLTLIGIDFKDLFSLQTHSLWQVGLYTISLAVLIMLLLVSFSVIGSIISFYGYTLSKVDDRYIRRSGLLTKHEVSMRLSRLQMIVRKQDWLDALLGRVNLKFEQSSDKANNQSASAQSNKIIVPSVKPQEAEQLIADAYPDNALHKIDFTPISPRFILRYIAWYLLPMWLISSGLALSKHNISLALLILLMFLLLSLLVILRWHRWGFARDSEYIYLRKGLFGVDYYCFPTYKVQQTEFQQSLMMKRRQLASVKLVLASGSLSVPLIPEQKAYSLINDTLYKLESSQRSWM